MWEVQYMILGGDKVIVLVGADTIEAAKSLALGDVRATKFVSCRRQTGEVWFIRQEKPNVIG